MRGAGCLALSAALLCGCSFLQVHSYYEPSAAGAEPREDAVTRCGGNPGRVLSGPPTRIVVRSDEVTLGIEADAYRVTTVTAGPLSLPVIPAFPPSFFPHRDLEAGDVLHISFRILEPRDEAVDFSRAVVEVVSSTAAASIDSTAEVSAADSDARADEGDPEAPSTSSFEAGEVSDELVTFKGWTRIWDLSDGWTLPLRVGEGDPASFRLSVRGLVLREKSLDFPVVEFTPARGWIFCEQQ